MKIRFSTRITAAYLALGLGLAAAGAANAATIIAGSVEAHPDCTSTPMEAWLSVGSTLIYQVEIPQHGTFEFHVVSGKYDLVVVGASGCLAEKEIEARENATTLVTLSPSPPPPEPGRKKASWLDLALPSALAGLVSGADCATCNGWNSGSPTNFNTSETPPWWYAFGATSYSNFGLPSPWRNGGVDGSMFPGSGGLWGDKPVLYVDGPEGAEVRLHAKLKEPTSWLVSVPRYGDTGWVGRISGHRFKATSKTGDAEYRYIYYDYRGDERSFQDSRGFCTHRDDLVPRMAAALKASGFRPSEIDDFKSYWTYKIPDSRRYCVYPQTRAEIAQVIDVSAAPAAASFTQLLFIVQLQENLDGKGKFRHAPVASWHHDPDAGPSHREPAAGSGIRLREWSVGFLEGREGGVTR